jgi:2-oxoglutarate ferredoxin oxidoreductase subunit beta
MGSAADMLAWQRDQAVFVQAVAKMRPEDLQGKFVIGELYRAVAPEYTAEYDKLIARVQPKGGKEN